MSTDSLAARKARWGAWYAGAGAPRHMFSIIAPATVPLGARPLPWHGNRQARIEWAWDSYCIQRERLDWLDDDALPYLDIFTGTEIFAEAFGCEVAYPEDNMPFALPAITRASEVDQLTVPELGATPLMELFEIADALRDRTGEAALVKMVDIQSPMDIAALIWDKNDFYPAMIEEPEAVKALADKVSHLLTAFLDAWFARYGREFIAHFPTYYMPNGLTLSEDEVGAVSTADFAEFFLPELVSLSARYGGLGMHCCANARHQWDGFLQIPNLRVLNICQPREVTDEAYRFFAPHLAQMHGNFPDTDPWSWPAQLPAGARVIFEIGAKSREEAIMLAERMREACG